MWKFPIFAIGIGISVVVVAVEFEMMIWRKQTAYRIGWIEKLNEKKSFESLNKIRSNRWENKQRS